MNGDRRAKLLWFLCGVIAASVAPSRRETPEMSMAPGSGVASAAVPLATLSSAMMAQPTPIPDDGKLRIICFGAHPDDNEFRAAGVAALWSQQGHHVKFVSCTNGDIGHNVIAGGPLAQRRTAEVERSAEILGIQTQVLDIHDGELLPTLENRRTITRIIREWDADVVMCHRPNDYHPDHRNVGLLVQDAAFMVTVPFFCPDTPHLEQNPVFLYYEDRFLKPNPFAADVVVAIDEVAQLKLACVEALASQTLEGGCCSGALATEHFPPDDPEKQQQRRNEIRGRFANRFRSTADRFRKELISWYGDDKAQAVQAAEAFEICEYGRQPTRDELRVLFPLPPGDR